jgi:hypothetical protein
MKCLVSCVTKEPKFRPTMQCQVGPFRSSNYADVRLHAMYAAKGRVCSYSLLDVLCNILRGTLVGGD